MAERFLGNGKPSPRQIQNYDNKQDVHPHPQKFILPSFSYFFNGCQYKLLLSLMKFSLSLFKNVVLQEFSICIKVINRFFILGAFACYKCDKKYTQKRSLYMHTKYDCGKEPLHKCNYCSYCSKRRANLMRHLFIKHHQK